MENCKYILITSAYNEELNIEKTIKSVISQTVLPSLWIIISDGSTDKTDEIVMSYAKKYQLIDFFRIHAEDKSHSFSSKVHAINKGLAKLEGIKYAFIGILDADLSFDETYYEKIIGMFKKNRKLGIAGGNVIEFVNGKYNKRIKSFYSVAGGVQLFRRECFEQTDGFKPSEHGGEDAYIEITARMKGWEVKTYPGIEVIHYGYIGGRVGGSLKYKYKVGVSCFYLGYHPFFYIIRCLYRIKEKPILISSIFELIGFFYQLIRLKKANLPLQTVRFLREEQLQRIKSIIWPFSK